MFSSARIWTASRATRAPKIRSTGVSHSPTQFYGYSTARIRATLARFYMTMHATLSAATPAPRVHSRLSRRSQWHRHSCPCAFAKSMTPRMAYAALSAAADFLIANARLEFNVSHSKQNLLKISNRERIAIFHPRFHPLAQKARATTRPPKVQPRFRPLQKNRDSYFDSHPFRPVPPAYLLAGARDLRSLVACRSSLVTGFLIYRTAIRNPCKALKT